MLANKFAATFAKPALRRAEKCRQLKCLPLEIGGVADHVLTRLHPTVAVAELVKEIKGASSHLVTHQVLPGEFFKWQGA